MLIAIKLENYNSRNFFISESIRNTVIENSSFIRIFYSTENVAFNGITFNLDINDYTISKYFNKWRCNFSIETNSALLTSIKTIENDILEKINITNKRATRKISEQIENGFIKIFSEDNFTNVLPENNSILLKMSGIWVSEEEYGITYKFLLSN